MNPVPPLPPSRPIVVPESPPLPQPVYESQSRSNQVFQQALEAPLVSEFDQKRREFLRSFDSCKWNCPGDDMDEMSDELHQSRALVVSYLTRERHRMLC